MTHYNFDGLINRQGTQCKKIERLRSEFGRDDLLPLWIADMDFAVCPDITDAIVRRYADHPVYGYTCPYDDFWQSIIDWHSKRNGFEFDRNELTYVSGLVSVLGYVLEYFTSRGDKIVIQEPLYYHFKQAIVGNGRIPVDNALIPAADGSCQMDLNGLERIFRDDRPRMMIVCNPHNPIGICWEPCVLREVARLAHNYGVILFVDEIFGDMPLYGHQHTSMATVSDEAAAVTITCGAPGKTFNISGLKSSWCVIKNPALRIPFFNWLDTNEFNCPNLTSIIATEAAYRHGHQWLKECLHYIEANIEYVDQFCRANIPAIRVVKPQAAFLLWLDCSGLGVSHDNVVSLFRDKAHLALNDGAIYGDAGSCRMRLNVGTRRAVLEQAMRQLEIAVMEMNYGQLLYVPVHEMNRTPAF